QRRVDRRIHRADLRRGKVSAEIHRGRGGRIRTAHAGELPGGGESMNASENAPRAAAFQRRLNRALAALVAVVTLSVFSVTYTADFVPWDDDINIYGNPHIRGITAESLKWMFTDTTYVHRYMPVGWLALAIDYQLAGGLNPTTYHAGNLLLHTINAVL